jgi:hypothetical protein
MNRTWPFLLLIAIATTIAAPQTATTPEQSLTTPAISIPEENQFVSLVTVPIRVFCEDTQLGTATGFFFATENERRLFLITNRHVVIAEPQPQQGRQQSGGQYPDRLVLKLHTNPKDLKQSEDYVVQLYRPTESTSKDRPKKERLWREIDKTTDVVAIELNTTDFQKYSIAKFMQKDLLPSDIHLGLGDSLVVIGYPLGFSDQVFNLPIAREATVASVFPIPFEGNRYFLVDARLHPGTSGSPVITRPTSVYTRGGQLMSSNPPVFYLVGINSAGAPELNLNTVWFADIILELIK